MDPLVLGIKLNPAQLQAMNPAFILLLIPFCSFVVYPVINRFFPLTPLRKIGIGLSLAAFSFLIPAWVESRISLGETPTIAWQIPAYFLLTLAEVMVSITALEFSYTQAPKSAKSLMLGLNFLSVSFGNLFTALVNFFGAKQLEGAAYYLFFTGFMVLAALLYVPVARRFKVRDVFHDEVTDSGNPPPVAPAAA